MVGDKQKGAASLTTAMEKMRNLWWNRRSALNGFPLDNEGYNVELSRPGGSLTAPFLKETVRLYSPSLVLVKLKIET